MVIPDFVESLQVDKRFKEQISALKYVPPMKPRYRKIFLSDQLRDVLKQRSIELFYSHQVEAINLIREGENVVVMTPTASGKSLIYNIPVIEAIIENPEHKALYIFPLKGLEQDQVKNLNELFDSLKINHPNSFNSPHPHFSKGGRGGIIKPAEIYDGDTSTYRRRKIREALPKVIFTNPDMLHLALNPFHKKWEGFFRNLRYVVIDEIHTYRGVFGSNVAHVIRRLRRICKYWGSHPQFIAASATIANPSELAKELTGLPFRVVDQSGAPNAGRYFIFINPSESPYSETTRIFMQCLDAGLRTIVFTKARKITELIYSWTINNAP